MYLSKYNDGDVKSQRATNSIHSERQRRGVAHCLNAALRVRVFPASMFLAVVVVKNLHS